MAALVDFDALAERYVRELHEEGVSVYAPITAAAVVADLARLAGVPVPAVVSEADHLHSWGLDLPLDQFTGGCTVCGVAPF